MDNKTKMMKSWDPNLPFENLVTQIEDGQTEEIRKFKIESNNFKQQIKSLKNKACGNNNCTNHNGTDSHVEGTHHC